VSRPPLLQTLLVQALAVLTGLVAGALLIWLTGGDPLVAYGGLWEGSLGKADSISETLVWATPYILAGLAVGLAFRGGLFNIGAEGQLSVGALTSAWVGFAVHGVPWPFHLLLALAAGALAGAIWAGFAGFLKARTSAHEVITTIMLNYVALLGTSYLLAGLLKDPSPFVIVAQTPKVLESARIPTLFADLRVHWGLVLALLLAVASWWLLFRSTIGFAIRTVGLNPSAARYAGISIGGTVVMTMAISGGLAGLAGAIEVLGVNYYHSPGFSVGYGFDSIAVALLGKSHPLGVIPAALLFGALRAGATRMQFVSQIPIDIISVVQGIILLLVAADELVRRVYRIGGRRGVSAERAAEATVARTWGRAE
jgi:general nucleoside transport system permease protein